MLQLNLQAEHSLCWVSKNQKVFASFSALFDPFRLAKVQLHPLKCNLKHFSRLNFAHLNREAPGGHPTLPPAPLNVEEQQNSRILCLSNAVVVIMVRSTRLCGVWIRYNLFLPLSYCWFSTETLQSAIITIMILQQYWLLSQVYPSLQGHDRACCAAAVAARHSAQSGAESESCIKA